MDIDKQINTDEKVNEIKQILFYAPIIEEKMKEFIITNNLANKSKSAQKRKYVIYIRWTSCPVY